MPCPTSPYRESGSTWQYASAVTHPAAPFVSLAGDRKETQAVVGVHLKQTLAAEAAADLKE